MCRNELNLQREDQALDDGIARMGEVVFSNQSMPVLRALGLGSCIGLCVLDPVLKLGCIAHIMLPESRSSKASTAPAKFADTTVEYIANEMRAKGAVKSRLRSAIVGGAQLFSFGEANERLDVGRRNAEVVKRMLKKAGIKLVAEDIGGSKGRTVILNTITGEVLVKQAGTQEYCLAKLS